MAKARGAAGVRRYMGELPARFLERILPGAARAGATVIAEEARHLLGDRRAETGDGGSVLIADAVKVRVRRKDDQIRARIHLEGPGAYVGIWLERGTRPHFISVDDNVREGRTVARINAQVKEGSLVIGDTFVGASVFHPGARPHPFLGPALHTREEEATAAAQSYVTRRAARAGVAGADDAGDDG